MQVKIPASKLQVFQKDAGAMCGLAARKKGEGNHSEGPQNMTQRLMLAHDYAGIRVEWKLISAPAISDLQM